MPKSVLNALREVLSISIHMLFTVFLILALITVLLALLLPNHLPKEEHQKV
ncbi:hypothetical protein [Sporolactobacillus laevolacticus]|uniref:Uncharacterized protein n=1 Tax=Sporolactobacillus laevolacticus DSM 442 TaxID=1395513 RepID=V6IZK0_9BACL|nr:hypothetical protein [Sporolactobacillus laevolacticus]EST12251.1 hypothetical protein P343_08560 [Sporolactobacillus laevolacticus DSM 442]